MKILDLYEKVERVVSKLPEPLQKPILREITPIKELFLLQRPPRLVLLGDRATGRRRLVNALFNAEVLTEADERVETAGWHEIARLGKGRLQLLDARRPVASSAVRSALAAQPPDLFLYLRSPEQPAAEVDADLNHASELLSASPPAALLGLLLGSELGTDAPRQQFHGALHSRQALSDALKGTFALPVMDAVSPEMQAREYDRLAEFITQQLPAHAKLEMARLSGARSVQMELAGTLTKSATAICAAVGTQPIPLADFPVLTALQVAMVTGIMYISGREMNAKLATEFLAAAGVNVGAALVFREGARAALKLVPFWGHAIAGGIAGAGTYAIGKSATAYFIGGASLNEARRSLLRRKKAPLQLPR